MNTSLMNQLLVAIGISNPERRIEIFRDTEIPDTKELFDEYTGFMHPLSFISFRRNLEGSSGDFKNCLNKEDFLEKLWQKAQESEEPWDEVVAKYSFEYYTTLSAEERTSLYAAVLEEKPYRYRKEIKEEIKKEILEGVSSWTAHEWLKDEMTSRDFEDLVTRLCKEKKAELLGVFDFMAEEEQAKKLFDLCCDDADPGISSLDAYCYAVKKILRDVKNHWLVIPIRAKKAFEEWSLRPMELNFQNFRKANAFFVAEKDAFKNGYDGNYKDGDFLEKSLKRAEKQIRKYQDYLNGNVWWFTTIENDENVDIHYGYHGSFSEVLYQIRSELSPKFLAAFDAGYITIDD